MDLKGLDHEKVIVVLLIIIILLLCVIFYPVFVKFISKYAPGKPAAATNKTVQPTIKPGTSPTVKITQKPVTTRPVIPAVKPAK
jgi:hypothetical protein